MSPRGDNSARTKRERTGKTVHRMGSCWQVKKRRGSKEVIGRPWRKFSCREEGRWPKQTITDGGESGEIGYFDRHWRRKKTRGKSQPVGHEKGEDAQQRKPIASVTHHWGKKRKV